MCYCKTSDAELAASIDAGTQKASELASAVEEDTAMREKEAAEFAAASGELKANIQAMTGALAALKKGLSAALLQTNVGDMLRNIVQHTPLLGDTQRDLMMSYLQAKDGDTESMQGR